MNEDVEGKQETSAPSIMHFLHGHKITFEDISVDSLMSGRCEFTRVGRDGALLEPERKRKRILERI